MTQPVLFASKLKREIFNEVSDQVGALNARVFFGSMAEALASESVDLGDYFTCLDIDGVTDHPNTLRTYLKTSEVPFYEDMGDSAAPVSKVELVSTVSKFSSLSISAAISTKIRDELGSITEVSLSDRVGRWAYTVDTLSSSLENFTWFKDASGDKWMLAPTNGAVDIRSLGVDFGDDIAGVLPKALEYANALTQAPFSSVVVRIPGGGIFYTNSAVDIYDKSVNIDATSARIIKNHDNGHMFNVYGTWEPVNIVSGSSKGSREIIVADATGIKPRSMIRVVSDDLLMGGYPDTSSGSNFRGEVAFVQDIDNNTVTLATPLGSDYETNARFGVYRDIAVNIRGGYWQGAEGHDGEWSRGIFKVQGAVSICSFDGIIISHCYGSSGLKLYGLNQPKITNSSFLGFSLSETHDFYDYAIEDGNCTGLMANGITAVGFMRHVYTTTLPQIQANGNELAFYGGPRKMLVTNVTANGHFQAALDTHHGSEDGVFCDWVIKDSSPYGSLGGLRGIGHIADNIVGTGGKYGIYVFTERGKFPDAEYINNHGTRDIIIRNCDFSQCTHAALKVGDVRNLVVRDCKFGSLLYRSLTFDLYTDAINTVIFEGTNTFINGDMRSSGTIEERSNYMIGYYGSVCNIENRGVVIFDFSKSNNNGLVTNGNILYVANATSAKWTGFGRVEIVTPATGLANFIGGVGLQVNTSTTIEDGTFVLPSTVRLGANTSQTRRVSVVGKGMSATSKVMLGSEVLLTHHSPKTQVVADILTADQYIRLPNLDPIDGSVFKIIRSASATGEFSVVVRQGSGTVTTVKTLSVAGEALDFIYVGSVSSWLPA